MLTEVLKQEKLGALHIWLADGRRVLDGSTPPETGGLGETQMAQACLVAMAASLSKGQGACFVAASVLCLTQGLLTKCPAAERVRRWVLCDRGSRAQGAAGSGTCGRELREEGPDQWAVRPTGAQGNFLTEKVTF